MLRLRLLGSPELQTAQDTLKLPLERISWLLTILAARADWVRREELLLLLWSDEIGLQQRLRQLLYRTKLLGLTGIESQAGRLRWLGSSDLAEFKLALQQGRELEALQLCQGDLLEGVTPNDSEFGAWLTLEREFIATQRREVALRLIQKTSPLEGLGLLEGLAFLDETIVLEALSLANQTSQVARGEAIFTRYERELLEYNEVPSPELRSALNALRAAKPAIPTKHSLPNAVTPLLGRETELQALHLLLSQSALITVLGIGGIGKTSLALQLARELKIEAVFVSLVGVQSELSFAPSIIAALGISFMSNNSLEDALYSALERRTEPLLLVLDNVEQCIETARAFAVRFSGLGKLKLLFTSRTRLGVRGEYLLELDGLSLPKNSSDLEQSGSGLAFLAAARRQRQWQPNESERQAVLRLCAILAGAPLALELAAAWLRAMSIFDIEHKITQSLDFLEGSLGDLPARQAGLGATFLYSWGLLSASEQRSLRRLSIFCGGFSQAAAIAVAGISHRDILSLSEKSLLRLVGGRLSLHELIREYTSQKLRQVESDWAEVGEAHAAYYLEFMQRNQNKLRTYEQITFLPILESELDNFRAAMTWALSGNDQKLAMELAESLNGFWVSRGLLREGIHWLEASLSNHQQPVSPLLVRVWSSLAQLQQMLGDLHTSVVSIKEAIGLATLLEDTTSLAMARSVWARSLNRLGYFEEMYLVCQETLRLPQGPLARAVSLSWLGQAELMARGNLTSATQHLEEALQTLRVHGSVSGMALVLSALGMVAAERQDFASARACLSQAMEMAQKIGSRFAQSLHGISLGRIEMLAGKLEAARGYFQESLEISQELAANRDVSYTKIQLGHIARSLHQPETAEQQQRQALGMARELNDQRLQLEALIGFANLFFDQKQYKIAAEFLGLALRHPQSNREIAAHGQATLGNLGQLLEPQMLEITMQRGLERGLETTAVLVLSQAQLA